MAVRSRRLSAALAGFAFLDQQQRWRTTMNRIFGVLCFSLVLISSLASAQQGAPMPTPIVEIYGCNFKTNKAMNDLHAVTTRFNAWADKNKMNDYTAFIVSPMLHGADRKDDVLWLGGWPNGTAMGADEAMYASQGREIDAAFDSVVHCESHSQYAEVVVHQPQNPPPEHGIVVFTDCTVHTGRTVPEALAALGQWSEFVTGKGLNPFSAVLFAVAGLPNDAHYTFKAVDGFDSMQAYGKYLDMYTSGGFMRAEELLDRVMDCNSARVYALERVRLAAPPAR
jgi:hypothetical protein